MDSFMRDYGLMIPSVRTLQWLAQGGAGSLAGEPAFGRACLRPGQARQEAGSPPRLAAPRRKAQANSSLTGRISHVLVIRRASLVALQSLATCDRLALLCL